MHRQKIETGGQSRLMSEDLLWPAYSGPAGLARIEAVPLAARPLPES
jgi:hypothetical protein